MDLKKRRARAKLLSAIFESASQTPTYANLECIESDVLFKADGDFKMILIKFSGDVFIYNKLPDGYSIKVNKDTIIIRNILGRKTGHQKKPINKYDERPTNSQPINSCKKLLENIITSIENVKKLV